MELCRIAPRQRYIKQLSDRMKADMIKVCVYVIVYAEGVEVDVFILASRNQAS